MGEGQVGITARSRGWAKLRDILGLNKEVSMYIRRVYECCYMMYIQMVCPGSVYLKLLAYILSLVSNVT